MAQQTTTKTIWYKQVEIGTDDEKLQPLLAAALKKRLTASARMMQIGESAEQHGINSHSVQQNMLVGQFLSFEGGLQQPLVTLTGASTYDLKAIKPPKGRDGNPTEWLDSIVYFACIDDHLMIAPTRSLSPREFEAYLLWLLGQTGVLAAGTYLALINRPSAKAKDDLRQKRVRAVTFGSKVQTVAGSEQGQPQDEGRYQLSSNITKAILKAIPGVLADLKLTDAINEDKIDVQVTVRVKGPRVLSEEGDKLLGALSRATRHMDPSDYSLTLDHVGEIKGDDLKLSKTVSAKITRTTGLIDEQDLFRKMADYFRTLMQAKVISP